MLTAVQNTKYAFSRSMGPRNVRKQVEILSTIYYFFLQIEGLALHRVENFTTIIVEINGDLKSKSKCFRSGIFKIVVLQTSQTSDNSESSQELTVFFFFNFRIASWIAGSLIWGLLDFGTRTSFCRV